MSRVDEIINYQLPEGFAESYGLESAYCYCLFPQEACELLERTVVERAEYRNVVLRKVCADLENEFQACHNSLIDNLMSALLEADHHHRQSFGFIISRLIDLLPTEKRQEVQIFLLNSPHVSIRRRGYKSASHSPEPPESAIECAWRRYGDYETAWLITKTFPVRFL
jgi:hypothetical protein